MRAFTRQLGAQSGVQLNPIRDGAFGLNPGNYDQIIAVIGRFKRGPIHRPFMVDKSTFKRALGPSESITVNALNEAQIQIKEALETGAYRVLVQRLSVPAAAISWVSFTSAATSTYAVSATAPTGAYTLAVKHLGCHNDGIRVSVHAAQKTVSGVAVANDEVTVRIQDAQGGDLFYITGSLTAGALDDNGMSYFIGDVATREAGDMVQISVGTTNTIATTHDAYGRDAAGSDKWSISSVLIAFSEGGTAYTNTEYDAAVVRLRNATEDFGYIISGGSTAVALLSKLCDLAYQTNRQFIFDIPGNLTPSAAITWVSTLGIGAAGKDHYPQAYWAPIRADDPLNGNSVIFGAGGIQAGYRCERNSHTNSYGVAPKNYPIAGKDYGIPRTRVTQIYKPSENEISDLAEAHINYIGFEVFNGGGRYVFTDSLTMAQSGTSYRRLISVAEMSSSLDEAVARFGKECLQLPMADAIRRMKDFIDRTFGRAESSGWMVKTASLNGQAFQYSVTPNAAMPAERMDVEYWVQYDGTTRVVHVQQTLTS